MAAIIAFPTIRRPARTHAEASAAGPAEILFFTGVRIERHPDETVPAPDRPIPSPERTPRQRRRN